MMNNDEFTMESLFNEMLLTFEKEKNKKNELASYNIKKNTEREIINSEIEKTIKKKAFLQKCSTKGKMQAEMIIENVNNRMLNYIFPFDVKFDIEQKLSGGTTYVYCFTEVKKENGQIIRREPTEGGGLGVVDAISIATRNVFLNEIDKTNKAPIFFDEPGKFISSDYISKIAEYLQTMQMHYKRQMFLITHDDFISRIGDNSLHVYLNDEGYSEIKTI